jgi:NAD(P)-dependent dehydrogenase (short-subunit alcohol dehydrogenase family)
MNSPVALITGAASGIGRQLALDLARDGYAIAAVDLLRDGLVALAEELDKAKVRHAWAVADVTDMTALQAAVTDLEARLGPTDLLLASAGVGIETTGLNYRADDMAKVIGVNLIGVSNSIAAVLPGMLARRRGHLVGLSSVASFRGLPRLLGYSASKAGLNALMDGLRVEVQDHGISVTTICPGWVRTPMTAPIRGKLDYLMDVDAAAWHIHYAIKNRLAFYAFPRPMVWRLRLLTWLPRSWQDRIVKRMLGQMKVRVEPDR